MGRYRSDESDDEYSKKSRKKKKRRARSRSSSDSESSRVSSSKSKKSKKKHRRSSRSRSAERRRPQEGRSSRRSRSSSADRHSSRKHDSRSSDHRGSRKSRSRSPPPKRGRSRSRSPSSRRRRSRSYSRGRRSRSRSPSRGHRRSSRSYSRERRSRSYDRTNSQRSSVERRRDASHSTASPSNVTVQGLSISEQIPGFNDMTPAEQAEERMRLALKAAAAADEKLKVKTSFDSSGVGTPASYGDSRNFANSVAAIESNSFVPSTFKSSRSTKIKEEPADSHVTHDDAIFGSLAMTGFTITPDPDTKPVQLDPDSIMHPSLYCDPQEKMDRWIQRLGQLRKRKLEGEAM